MIESTKLDELSSLFYTNKEKRIEIKNFSKEGDLAPQKLFCVLTKIFFTTFKR